MKERFTDMGKLEDDMLYKEIFMSSKSDGGTGGITPSGVKAITENGMHDVTRYASAKVDVPVPDGYVYPEGAIEITENGKHDVKLYESVNVNVQDTVPDGCLDIYENGYHDVTDYSDVYVDVPIPDGYLYPEGTLEVTENGTYLVDDSRWVEVSVPGIIPDGSLDITENGVRDVTDYASVNVNVPIPDGYVTPDTYINGICSASLLITDLSNKFAGVTEESDLPYATLALPGFSTMNVKDFTNTFANWGTNVTTIPCGIDFMSNTTENGIFTNSKYIQNIKVYNIRNNISFVPIKSLSNASLLSILNAVHTSVTGKTLRLPSACFNGQTESVITGNAELNAAYQNALNAGWTITFNLAE